MKDTRPMKEYHEFENEMTVNKVHLRCMIAFQLKRCADALHRLADEAELNNIPTDYCKDCGNDMEQCTCASRT